MKLKKLLALALAGVMAVSMLAGCKGGNKPEDPTEEPVDTSIASYFNDAQADNEVKAEFTYDSDVENMIKKALEVYGTEASKTEVETQIKDSMDDVTWVAGFGPAYLYASDTTNAKNTYAYLLLKDDTSAMTDEALVKDVVDDFDFASVLLDERTTAGIKYDYTNTGKVAMVKSVDKDGTTHRYVAVIVTVTCATSVA